MPFQIGFKYETAAEESAPRNVLQAPTPPTGIITTSSGAQQQQQPLSAIYTTQPKSSSGAHQVRSLSPTKASSQQEQDRRSSSTRNKYQSRRHSTVGSYFADLPRMVFFCLCCPAYKCVLLGCLFELVVSSFFWWKILNLLIATLDAVQIKDVFLVLFLTFWVITLFTSTGMLVVAHRRKNASYILPRLIQQLGLLICSLGLGFLLICYFSGAATTINNWIIWAYELFLEYDMTQEDEREMARQLHTLALVLILIDIMFICYVSCGICMTKHFYDKMKKKYGSGFHPVAQNEQEPSAPQQPSINPYYKA